MTKTTMKPYAHITLVALLTCAVSGCGPEKGKNGNDIKLSSEPQVNLVEVVTLHKQDFSRQLVSNGRLAAAKKSSMAFTVTGVIEKINVTNGQSIKAGDVIASLDRTEASLEAESAKIALSKAELDYYDVLVGLGYAAGDTVAVPANIRAMARARSGYDAAINSLKQAELNLEGTLLRAPFNGKVADIQLREYDACGTDVFCVLLDDNVLEVTFPVLESEYPFLEKGLPVKVSPFAGGGSSLSGRIESINPIVDENGQISVKASVRNDGSLIDGMNVKVTVEKAVPDMFVVPKSAVVIRDNLEVLFRYEDGNAKWTYVNVLMANSSEYAVSPNLSRGASLE